MKKIVLLLIIISIALSVTVSAKDIKLYLDGSRLSCDPSPVIIDGRTLIPARAVFEKMGAKVSWNDKARTVLIEYKTIKVGLTIDSDEATVNNAAVTMDVPAQIINDRTMIPLRFVGEAIGATVSWNADEYAVYIESPDDDAPPIVIEDVSFSSKNAYDQLEMTASGAVNVTVMNLTDPTRMVLDMQNVLLTELNAGYDGKFVDKVRYGVHEDYLRIVADNETIPRYIFSDNEGIVNVRFYPEKKNFDYIGSANQQIIFNSGLTVKAKSTSAKELVFTVSKKLSDETLEVNDALVRGFEVSGTTVTVKLNKAAGYTISGNVIRLNVMTEVKSETKNHSGLVVLDAGHGGKDPGSIGYDETGKEILLNEKDVNLTITLMVNDILKSRGVETVLTRSTDVYLGLVERANVANDNGAELFVCIHNNSIPDPEYKGSMVLYYLKSAEGKKLADNILTGIVKKAGTIDRGLRDGTNMAVIKHTTMPAVIVECGCLTNQEELADLMDDDFCRLVAEGIADGIIKTLKQ